MSSLSDRIKEAIADAKRKGVTIKAIAEACGISVQSVYQWQKPGERKESHTARLAFAKAIPRPATGKPRLPCPGYIIDHVQPLCAGWMDAPANMQWQTIEAAKAKDRTERQQCRR